MNGYFRARRSELNRELRLLDFSDLSSLEEVSEDIATMISVIVEKSYLWGTGTSARAVALSCE